MNLFRSTIGRKFLMAATGLILIAFVIGSPISYFMMKEWLEGFPYRVSPSPWIFVFAGTITLLVALVIIGYHSLKAAEVNPVSVLKDE